MARSGIKWSYVWPDLVLNGPFTSLFLWPPTLSSRVCGHIGAEMIPFSMGQALKRLRGDLCPYAHMVISDVLMLFLCPYWDGLVWGLMCVCSCVNLFFIIPR